jgi:uncharacterized repeat protein (TIGR01451 family)
MKRLSIAGLGAIAVIATVPFISIVTGFPNLHKVGEAITSLSSANALNVAQPKIDLSLGAQKQVVQKDQQGQEKVTWETLQGNVKVAPGDVIRYTLTGKNNGERPAKNLVLNQPIPAPMVYVLTSATATNGATTTYSIDKGKTYVANPTIQVKLPNGKIETRPAPAEMYTNIRWKFNQPINPKAVVNASYEAKVR